MPWIVYETTNKVNGKKYVGVHKQDGEEFDGYLGSGKYLSNAIKKHGEDAFERRTLFSYDDEDAAYIKESEIVTEEWCGRSDTYNIKVGGSGGFPHNDPEFKARHSERMRAMNADPEFKARHSERSRETMRAMNADPEFKARQAERSRERMRARNANPEFKKRSSEGMLARHADPEFKAKRLAGIQSYYQSRRREKANALLCFIDAPATEGPACQSNP
ncbi:MAG: hypothetical protein EBR52_08840 [Microbacteriaceae bacterium]|nr:hypothetical protein [Microbacteriaceae bacterium]